MAGLMMAELIAACERDHDQDPVCGTGLYTGLELNVGFYLRNRDVHHDSSFTVLA